MRPRGSWQGSVFLWHGEALYVGRTSDTTAHAHHALQITIGLEGRFRLRVAPRRTWRAYRGAVVASDREHQLDGGGAPLALLYLDADSARARRLAMQPARGVTPIPPGQVGALVRLLTTCARHPGDERRARKAAGAIVRALGDKGDAARRLDPRIAEALALIETLPEPRVPLAVLAARVGLSAGRFGHLCRAQTGLPLRRYLLWMRLQDAVAAMAGGASLTAAALDAGFADSAHLTRTFRRMFGVAPSDLAPPGER